MNKEITFICPALNEEKILENTIRTLIRTIEGLFDKYEILLFNDGSTDNTLEVMHKLSHDCKNIRVFSNKTNKNIGYCFKEGMKKASYPYIQFICADSIFDRKSYVRIAKNLGQTDLIIPYISNIESGQTYFRYVLSKVYRNLMNFLFNLNLRYHNGLPVFRTNDLKKINIKSDGFFFQFECLARLIKLGKSYIEIECCCATFRSPIEDRSRAITLKNLKDMLKGVFILFYESFSMNANILTRKKRKR